MTDQTPSPDEILSLASQLADVAAEQTLKWVAKSKNLQIKLK